MMNRAGWVGGLCAVVLCACLGADGPSTPAKDQKKAQAQDAKIVLFDGKTLDGWKKADFYHSGAVKVEDGSIVLVKSDSMTGVTCTRKDLPKSDYELTYEAMRVDGDDFFAAATMPVGESFMTFVNGGWGGHISGLSSIDGADASENETTANITFKNKTWYKYRVRVTAEVIRCWVDDKAVVEVKIKDRQVGTRLEVRANQPLGFATWETGGAIRKVEIRRLSSAEVVENDKTDKP